MHQIILRTLAGAAFAAALATGTAHAAAAQPTAAPTPPPAPTPQPSGTPLPYPAYGTPVPGVNGGVVDPHIPARLTLQQAVAIGYASSPLLAQARASLEVATAPVGLAKTALLPNISGSASTTRSFTDSSSRSSSTSTNSNTPSNASGTGPLDYTSNSANVTLRQLIFDGGKVLAQLREAKAAQSASAATYQRTLQTVAFNVATAYYNLLAAQRATQVAIETVRVDEVNEDLVRAQIRAGTAARTDLATVQLSTAQGRLAVVQAQGTELSSLAAFANSMGLDANTLVLATDDVPPPGQPATFSVTIPSYTQAFTRALAQRPDVISANYTTLSNEAALKVAKLGLAPSINGTASTGTASTDLVGGTYRPSSSLGLALTLPIYDQGITAATIAQARGNLDLAKANQLSIIQGVQLNVKQALVAFVSAREGLDQANAELAQATEVLKSTQAQYKAGVTTLPLLLNAQVGLTKALTDQSTAVYSLRQAQQAFLYAEGANTGN